MWISHRHTSVPALFNLLPSAHCTPLGCYSALVCVPWVMQQIPIGCLFCILSCMFPCYSLHISHICHALLFPPPPKCPAVCSLCSWLHCCPSNNFISTIFLCSIYISIWYLVFSFWPASLCIIDSGFIHLIRTDSNTSLFMAEEYSTVGFPGGSVIKNLPAVQEMQEPQEMRVWSLGAGRSLGGGHGNPLQ